jgi:L-asparaginase
MGQKIVILGTGGTIAGQSASALDHTGYTAGQLEVADLLAALPLDSFGPGRFITEQVAQLDSKDMGFDVWVKLAQRVAHFLSQADVQAIVITHGTDTLEETAYFLHALLAPGKPVVLTCAMRPASALAPDGPQNMMDALALAVSPGACGVSVVCAGAVYGPEDVQKVHPYRLNAFSGGDAGPIAYVEDGQVRLLRAWPMAPAGQVHADAALVTQLADVIWPRVEVVMSYAGADGLVVRDLVDAGVQGLVVATTGNGTVHQDLEAALVLAMKQGVRVLRATRCTEGRMLPGAHQSLPAAPGLSPVKARIALMMALMRSNQDSSRNSAAGV